MDTCVAPLSEETYELPVPVETAAGEYTITVSFHLKEDTIWAKAGHEVAFGQYVYAVEKAKAEFAPIKAEYDKNVKDLNKKINMTAVVNNYSIYISHISDTTTTFEFN